MDAIPMLACPHCGAMNRVPAARLGEAPKCGRCKQALFAGHPVALTTATFDLHATRSQLPLLVDFWATWCGPCQMMAPHFEAAARDLEPHFRLAKVDTDAEQQLGARFGIRTIPTLALFHQGRELARQPGAMGREQIVGWARAALAR